MNCVDCGKEHPIMITREIVVTVATPLDSPRRTKVIEEQACAPCYREALETRRIREARGLQEAR